MRIQPYYQQADRMAKEKSSYRFSDSITGDGTEKEIKTQPYYRQADRMAKEKSSYRFSDSITGDGTEKENINTAILSASR
jgi:hypothetical protein